METNLFFVTHFTFVVHMTLRVLFKTVKAVGLTMNDLIVYFKYFTHFDIKIKVPLVTEMKLVYYVAQICSIFCICSVSQLDEQHGSVTLCKSPL